jgi:hypothetical protein
MFSYETITRIRWLAAAAVAEPPPIKAILTQVKNPFDREGLFDLKQATILPRSLWGHVEAPSWSGSRSSASEERNHAGEPAYK